MNTFQEDLLQLIIRHPEEFKKPEDAARIAEWTVIWLGDIGELK